MNVKDLSLPAKPDSFGEDYKFPEDMTRLSNEQLSGLMSRLAAYKGYVLFLLALEEVNRRRCENALRIAKSEIFISKDDGKRTQKSINEEIANLPEVKDIAEKLEWHETSIILYTHLKDIYQGHIEVLSRDISRRGIRL